MALDRLLTTYRMVRYGVPLLRLRADGALTLSDRLERQARRRAGHPFVVFEGGTRTYAEMNADANRVAHWGGALGLRQGDVVAVLMTNSPSYLTTWMGLAKIGVTSALVNPHLTGAALGHALDEAGCRHVVVGGDLVDAYESIDSAGRSAWSLRESGAPDAGTGRTPDITDDLAVAPETDPDASARDTVTTGDPLVYLYTSGTTGLPKAARMSHLRYLASGAIPRMAGLGPSDTMACTLPLHHGGGGAMAVMGVLDAGATLALHRRFSATSFWDDARATGATAFQYVGELCRYLLNQPPNERDRDHDIRLAVGNGLRPDIWEEFQQRFGIERIVELYSATESNIGMVNLDNKVGAVGRRPPRGTAPLLVRYDVAAEAHARGADGFCIEVGPGEPGELLGEIDEHAEGVEGRFEGYTSDAANDAKIVHDVRRRGDRWFRTGDLLRRDDEGYYYFVDRIGDTFRWKGENVSTQEVAEALATHPCIDLVNVYGVEVPGAEGRVGMAAVVTHEGFDGGGLYTHAVANLPDYAVPAFVRLQTEADLTATLKLRKVDLQRQGYDPTETTDPIYVRDDAARAYVRLHDVADAQVG